VKGTTAEVDKLTKTKFGAAVVSAATSAEAAVKFVTLPTAKGGAKKITVSGSTDVGGFVYCALSKAGTRRVRMLANTTAAKPTLLLLPNPTLLLLPKQLLLLP